MRAGVTSKLYKKLYFYTFIVLISTVILTATIVNQITRRDFQGKFYELLESQVAIVKIVFKKQVFYAPSQLQKNLKELEKETGWDISYWKDNKCISNCNREHTLISKSEKFEKLLLEKKIQVTYKKDRIPVVLIYLDKQNTAKGFVIVSLNNFPPPPAKTKSMVLYFIFIAGFLSLFLIPYTKFVLKPFKELMDSINNISEGNFSTMIPVNQKSEFKEIAEAFNQMSTKIQEMIKEKQKLVAYISHELKTPLTKIQIAQELLFIEGKGNKKYINSTIQETDNLNRLIDDLLDTSELELNFDREAMNKIDFKEIVEKNVEKNNLLFEKNNLKINMKLSEKPIFLKLNSKLMDHALNNIFSNTIKYAPIDSEVDLTLTAEKDKVIFSVRDYGPGVEEKLLEKIFEPFYRTRESKARKFALKITPCNLVYDCRCKNYSRN